MQIANSVHIARAEWRWTTLVGIFLLLLSFLPFLLIALLNTPDANWRFMGALHGYQDAAASLARINQGIDGKLLVHFQHTPDVHTPVLIESIYVLIGQASRLTGVGPIVWFHLTRMMATLFMYLAFYQLGATIWVKLRSRRIFFLVVSLGSGVGWLLGLLPGFPATPDLTLPLLSPFYAALVNVHYPLALACLALLVGVFIPIFRYGHTEKPSLQNDGAIVLGTTIVLSLLYPDALIVLSFAYIINLLVHWYQKRRLVGADWHWGLWVLVPALPVMAYDLLALYNNPVLSTWLMQRGESRPDLLMLVLAMGIPLLLALPGLWRALQRFEADGDRFMLVWFLSMVIATYLPLRLNHYFLLGLMLPIAYFVTRSVEDFWFARIKRRYRKVVYFVMLPVIAMSNLSVLLLPTVFVSRGWIAQDGMFLEPGYQAVLQWLEPLTDSDEVILAAPDVGAWIPFWAQARPVYGHPAETFDSEQRLAAVQRWYRQADATNPVCTELLRTEAYQIKYVLLGPREQDLGVGACTENLELVAIFDTVQVFLVE